MAGSRESVRLDGCGTGSLTPLGIRDDAGGESVRGFFAAGSGTWNKFRAFAPFRPLETRSAMAMAMADRSVFI